MKNNNSITDVPGILVGHTTDSTALTGCTVILCEAGAVGGVDQRGGSPGTRETDALHPMHMVQVVHAVVLSGGSAFGLESATGVVRYLEEKGVGFDVGVAKAPIVPAAILFDLGIGSSKIRPDAQMGYTACQNAHDGAVEEGNAGAGTGATVGKIMGPGQAMKSGIGSASIHLQDGLIVAAIVAVNALGDVIDPSSGKIVAGTRAPAQPDQPDEMPVFMDTLQVMRMMHENFSAASTSPQGNTVIGVVATNARLNKEMINKVAQMAQDGLARAIRPAHTMYDGDTIFALSLGEKTADVNLIGALAAEVFSQAILRAVQTARSAGGYPAISDHQD